MSKMLYFNFSIIIYLCLYLIIFVIFVKKNVRATELDDLNVNERLKYIKCSYLFCGLTHMKITKIMLIRKNEDLPIILTKIGKYNENIKKQISSLYDNAKNYIRTLWLINLYIHGILWLTHKHEYVTEVVIDDFTYNNIIRTHDFVIQHMESDSENCDKSNMFHIDNKMLDDYNNKDDTYLNDILIKNDENFLKFLNLGSLPHLFRIKMSHRFSKTFMWIRQALKHLTIKHFQKAFSVQVSWDTVLPEKIHGMYLAINELQWSSDKLQIVKTYYKTIFDLFKIIMLRLTWKHFLYLQCQNMENVENLAKEWLKILDDFSKLTCVENDNDIIKISSSIKQFIAYIPKNSNGSIDKKKFPNYYQVYFYSLISDLQVILTNLCVNLNCFATYPMFLLGDELPDTEKPTHNPTDVVTVEYYSLLNAKSFIKNIKIISKTTDYGVIRTFINYIDEFNKQ